MLTLLKQKMNSQSFDQANHRTGVLIIIAGVCGLFIHFSLIFIFFALDLHVLSLLNIASCTLWGLIIYLGMNGQQSLAIFTATVEVIAHSMAITLILGTAFGFHTYLWPISILVALNPTLSSRTSAAIGTAVIVLYGALSLLVTTDRTDEFSVTVVNLIYFSNIMVAGMSMILSGMVIKRVFSYQHSVLTEYAQTDELTRVFNRRYVLQFLENAEANRRRHQLPYCICICDLDHFKSINDTYGHGIGDKVLVKFADFMKASVRKTDCVARWGGEEFLIVLTNAEGAASESTMNNILSKLRTDHKIEVGKSHRVSMSVGIAQAGDDVEIEELVKRADNALYKAKVEGRDRVVSFEE